MTESGEAVRQATVIEQLFSGKIRAKLLLKLFINPESRVHLRGLERDFDVSSNTVRLELNKLSQMSLIKEVEDAENAKVKQYSVNNAHPMFDSIRQIILKYVGIDSLIEEVLNKLGDVKEVYLTGDLAEGNDSPIIDLIIIGKIDKEYLVRLIDKAEPILNKKIRFGVLSSIKEFIRLPIGKSVKIL